jgi:hypothetical protein
VRRASSANGYADAMSETPDRDEAAADEARIASRADLLPEEKAAGSDDPEAQATEILRESDERTADPEGTGAESTQTSTPDERPE